MHPIWRKLYLNLGGSPLEPWRIPPPSTFIGKIRKAHWNAWLLLALALINSQHLCPKVHGHLAVPELLISCSENHNINSACIGPKRLQDFSTCPHFSAPTLTRSQAVEKCTNVPGVLSQALTMISMIHCRLPKSTSVLFFICFFWPQFRGSFGECCSSSSCVWFEQFPFGCW